MDFIPTVHFITVTRMANTNTISQRYQGRIKRLISEWMAECSTSEGLREYLLELAPHSLTRLYSIWVAEVEIALSAIAPDPAPVEMCGGVAIAPNAEGQLCLLL